MSDNYLSDALLKGEGPIDFRALIFLGNLAFMGTLALMLAEFRDGLAGPVAMAAAFLMFQWSYYEAGLWTSGGLTNMGAIFFAFAGLAAARRAGAASAAATMGCAALAAGSSASGLFVLPIAAIACAFAGQRRRAWVFAAASALLWIFYFVNYMRPPNHPSPLVAAEVPLPTLELFLLVIGSVSPGTVRAIVTGALLLAAVGALAWKGAWSRHPTAILWLAYLLLSAAAAAVGRVGLGVYPASRYAIFSTCFLVLAFLGLHDLTRPWSRRATVIALAGAAAASIAITGAHWHSLRSFAFNGTLLTKAVAAAPGMALDPYFGMYFPYDWSTRLLVDAERRGIFVTPGTTTVYPAIVRASAEAPSNARDIGSIDEVTVDGTRVVARGWTDVPATLQGRTVTIVARGEQPLALSLEVMDRSNAARELNDARIVFGGFRLRADYSSERAAHSAADELCVVVDAPGAIPALPARDGKPCRPGVARQP